MKFYDRRLSFDALAQIRSFLYITTKNAYLQLIQKEKTRLQRYEKFIVGFE